MVVEKRVRLGHNKNFNSISREMGEEMQNIGILLLEPTSDTIFTDEPKSHNQLSDFDENWHGCSLR